MMTLALRRLLGLLTGIVCGPRRSRGRAPRRRDARLAQTRRVGDTTTDRFVPRVGNRAPAIGARGLAWPTAHPMRGDRCGGSRGWSSAGGLYYAPPSPVRRTPSPASRARRR
jgi:hypothetical protein